MKVLLQRVLRAAVRVDDATVGEIVCGLVALVCVERGDDVAVAGVLANRTAELRMFPDERSVMNLSVEDVRGGVLVISQFTLAASTRRGRRPSFSAAAPAGLAEPLYLHFAECLRSRGLTVACGVFGAHMQVELINDGPVTLLLEGHSPQEKE